MTPIVGQQWSATPKLMTPERLRRFSGAGVPGDFHTDDAIARASGWPATVAQGAMSKAFVEELLIGAFGVQAVSEGAEFDMAFIQPVYAGDVVVAHAEVRAIEERVDRWLRVVLDAWCENQAGAKVAAGTASVALLPG